VAANWWGPRSFGAMNALARADRIELIAMAAPARVEAPSGGADSGKGKSGEPATCSVWKKHKPF
jgi:hypothetical protein